MNSNSSLLRYIICAAFLAFLPVHESSGKAPRQIAAANDRVMPARALHSRTSESGSQAPTYKWNVGEMSLPLLGLTQERLRRGVDQTLTYPAGSFDFPIFRSLGFNNEEDKYLMPARSSSDPDLVFIEFTRTARTNTYRSAEGMELVDRGGSKTIQTGDGTRFLFIQYPDGEFRCAAIKQNSAGVLNLLYTANGLALHGIIDASGRSLTFNYGKQGIQSLTQTWMSNLEGFTRTWLVSDDDENDGSHRFAHALNSKAAKPLPANALIHEYTAQMIACDELLARIFGGPGAVAAGNGFEPAGLAAAYPFYRGDVVGDDGRLRLGHLSHAIHLYGSPDGKGDSPLYVPAGFTSHTVEPSPTDAALTFYYPRLGNLTDVTLAVFHIAGFQIVTDGDRVRIGNIGGPGGSSPLYRHSHIEFYRGNTGLPPAAARASLRIDPATVFQVEH